MSLAPRRAFACSFRLLVLVALAWTHRADAQPASPLPSRRVVVLVVLPSAARLDASSLRVDIGNELGADVVTRDDPLAPVAMGTLTVGLDASAAHRLRSRAHRQEDDLLRVRQHVHSSVVQTIPSEVDMNLPIEQLISNDEANEASLVQTYAQEQAMRLPRDVMSACV